MSEPSKAPLDLETAVIEFRLAVGPLGRRLRAEVNPSDLTLAAMRLA